MTPTHSRQPALPILVGIFLLLAGCSTPPTPTPPPTAAATAPVMAPATPPATVAPPAPVVEAKPATITGSEEGSTMFDNLTAYVAEVDGHAVPAGRQGWKSPLSI